MDIDALASTSQDVNAAKWQGDLPNLPGIEVRVRSYSSQVVMKGLGRAARGSIDADGNVADADQERIDLEVMANYVLTDWKGFTKDGKPLPYSPEEAKKLLSSEIFRAGVDLAAYRVKQEADKALEALVKNSSTPSKSKPKAA